MKGGACTSDLFEDVRGFCRSDAGLRVAVVVIDVVADGGDQLLQVLEDAAADPVYGQIAEESFDHVEPGSRLSPPREPQAHWTGTVQESTVFVLPEENNSRLAATLIRRGGRHV